jgi:HK97 family phage major capsid protein
MADANVSRADTEREAEIKSLRDRIAELKHAENLKREHVRAYVDECKRAGLDPVTGLNEADREAFDRIDRGYKEADELASTRKEFERRLERLVVNTAAEADLRSGGDPEHPEVKRAFSLAERFLASEEYRKIQRSGALEMAGVRINTAKVVVASREQLMGALFPSTMRGASLDVDALIPVDQQLYPPISIPQRELRVRDLVTVGSTDTDTVEWVEETVANHAAAETPYGTAAPESTYEYDVVTASVRRIPHHVKATKGQLADAGQLRTLLDNRLVYGVAKRLDTQMISGSGAGNLVGILNTPNLQDVDATGIPIADALHKGITAVRLSLEDEPTAFGLHPDVYEQFVLAKGTDGHYLSQRGPQDTTAPNVWGKPAVVSTVFPNDSVIVGNWKQGATLWLRSGISVAATDSDQDDFLKGIITILAEVRAAFAVTQVNAFCEITNVGAAS